MADFENPYETLEELDDATVNPQIIVRLIRLWEARNPRRGNQLMSLDLLLLDEKDNLIKASINHRLIGKFRNILQEGSVIHIKNFDLGKSNDKFKITDHKYNIYFNQQTTITDILDDTPVIGKTKFRIQDYENLLRIANTNEELPDVIGKIVFILGINLRDIHSTQKVMASVLLQDGSKVRLSVWDNIASDFRAFLSATNRNKRVVVITAVNPKMFSGELYLNTSSATRFYMNEDIPEVKKYMSLHNIENFVGSPLDEREMEPANLPHTTISQMLSFLDVEVPQEKKFYCNTTIVGIDTRNGWNYVSCSKCFKKLIKEESCFKCPQCDDTNIIGIVRFRLELLVSDETDNGTFIVFDKDGRNLTNTLASEILSIEGETDEKQDILPTCIQELIGRKFVFEINIKPFDFKARYKTFTVTRIVTECFDTQQNVVQKKTMEEETSRNKETVKINKQFSRKIKKEARPVTDEEKKTNHNRGKRVKLNP